MRTGRKCDRIQGVAATSVLVGGGTLRRGGEFLLHFIPQYRLQRINLALDGRPFPVAGESPIQSDPSSKELNMDTAKGIVVGVVVLALVALLAVGGYLGGWWLREDVTNRETGIANESLARQQARLDEVSDTAVEIAAIDTQVASVTPEQAEPLRAQRVALVTKFCEAYGGLTGRLQVSPSVETLYYQEC